ncbi:MAG: hypothetical protein HC875_30575 [Anaerolineales bacterium]|nr:hypothetical protein [Anaerolineales bacterium]
MAGQLIHIPKKITFVFAALGAFVLYELSAFFLFSYAFSLGWEKEGFLHAIMYPIALSVVLGLVLVVRDWGLVTLSLFLTCLLVLTFPDLQANLARPFDHSKPHEMERNFYPFSYFAKSITYTPLDRYFISEHIQQDYKMLCEK